MWGLFVLKARAGEEHLLISTALKIRAFQCMLIAIASLAISRIDNMF